MDIIVVTNVVQILANISVLATVGFLWFQVRDSRRAISHAHAQSHAQAMNAFYHMLFSIDGLATIYQKGRTRPQELSADEQARFFYACVALFSAHEDLYLACQGGLMPKNYFDGWDMAFREDLQDPGFQIYWGQEGSYYDAPFRRYVDGAVQRIKSSAAPA